MPTVWVLQHSPCETLGTIGEALGSAGVAVRSIRSFAGESVPVDTDEASGLIVMGGPMGVYDHPRYPYLLEGQKLIEQFLKAQRPILGVCLGSQLLATVLGARVMKAATKEIGWYPVTRTAWAPDDPLWKDIESPFMAFHWHGDVFPLPEGALRLASSALTACQAFRYGECAYGLLFHLEVTQSMIQAMVRAFSDELREAKLDGSELVGKARRHLPALRRIGGLVFQRWARLLGAGAPTNQQIEAQG